MKREKRQPSELRPVIIKRQVLRHAAGSVEVSTGHTRVLVAVSVQNLVPKFLNGSGKGWVTAEYSMLPASTTTRTPRKTSGRSQEIQRIIGRSLRAVTELEALDKYTLTVDCDVLEADGGTRTASITGAWVALADACRKMEQQGLIQRNPIKDQVAAVSVGIVDGHVLLDLDYEEDSQAEVDLNVVMTGKRRFVEVQGTAEGAPFSRNVLDKMLDAAKKGIEQLIAIQNSALKK